MALNLARTRFGRLILELHEAFRSGKCLNCRQLAKTCEVSSKTIQRDLKVLRDELGAPLKYDSRRRGYCYADRSWSLPGLDIQESELTQMLVAQQMASQFQGTPLARTLSGLADRLLQATSGRPGVDPLVLRQQVSFHGAPVRPIQEQVWITILEALRKDKVICIRYQKSDQAKSEKREIEPIHLACVEGDWYLVAHDRSRQAVRHFSVSRIRKAELTEHTFEFHAFDPDAYFTNRFGRYIGAPGEHFEVVLRFDRSVAALVMERQWHPRQKVSRHRDGSITLTFPVPELLVVRGWVLQWGGAVKVVKPKQLRDEVSAEAAAVLSLCAKLG